MSNGLEEALRIAQLGDLPPAVDGTYKNYWLKAIAKVQRANGEMGYCIAVNDGDNSPRIIRDLAPNGIILKVLAIYPYEESSRNIIPRFSNDEQILKYLCKYGYKREEIVRLMNMEGKDASKQKQDKDIINGYIAQVANKQAQIKLESDEQAKKLAEMADPKIKERKSKERKYGRTAKPKTERGKSKD